MRMSEIKLCKDCKHYLFILHDSSLISFVMGPSCTNKDAGNGSLKELRLEGAPCGPSGMCHEIGPQQGSIYIQGPARPYIPPPPKGIDRLFNWLWG